MDAALAFVQDIKTFQAKIHPSNFYTSIKEHTEWIRSKAYEIFKPLKAEHSEAAVLIKATILKDIMPLKRVLDDIAEFDR